MLLSGEYLGVRGSNFEQRPIWHSSVTNAAYQKGLDVGKQQMDGYLNDTLANWQPYEKNTLVVCGSCSLKKKRDNLAEGKQSSTQFWGYVPVSSHIAIRNHDFNAIFAAINLHFHRLNIDFPIIFPYENFHRILLDPVKRCAAQVAGQDIHGAVNHGIAEAQAAEDFSHARLFC